MKKGIISFLILTAIFAPVLAGADEIKINNPLGETSTVPELLAKIMEFIRKIALAVAPIFIIIAGYLFITAMGDPEKITKAKKTILWTLIGLLVILMAEMIADSVVEAIKGTN